MSSTDMFSSGKPASREANAPSGSQTVKEDSGVSTAAAPGTQTRATSRTRKLGSLPPRYDKRKWGNFDTARGVLNAVAVEVTRDDRMSAVAAGDKMREILAMFGLDKANEGQAMAFMRGVWLCHAVNSGSTLQPGRTTITVEGTAFPYSEVVAKLGVDIRRFFRTFADETTDELKRLLDAYDPHDSSSVEVHSWIQSIAVNRGLQRYPYLIHDSAAADTRLTLAERAALNRSSNLVLGSTLNAVDSMQARAGALSSDAFDSTNGERVEGAGSVSRGRR